MIEQAIERVIVLGPVAFAAFFLSLALIVLLRPSLARYAMARPNARSSHHSPTPQGGGIAVVVATLGAVWTAVALMPMLQNQRGSFLIVTAAAVLLALVGAFDDLWSLPAISRFPLQCVAVGAAIATLPNELQILPQVPWWIERAGLFVGGLWFVNLVNFMDGLDWMTVAEVVPATGTIVVLGLCGVIDPLPALVAAALLGAILGFAPFNKPVARLFLGDVGSLPIGLLLGWLLLELAARGQLAGALILPLYYLADGTITLMRRVVRREPVWRPHRTHFYQRATDNGFTVPEIIARVFLVNLVLAALAVLTVAPVGTAVSLVALAAGLAAVTALLVTFARRRR